VSPVDKDNSSFGTGALIDGRRRLVVTNYHVVEKRPEVIVFFPSFDNGQVVTDPKHYITNRLGIRGKVIHFDIEHDLAIIELETLPAGVKPLPLARQSVRPGQVIHAIGNSGLNDGTLWRYSKGEVRSVYHRKAKTAFGNGSVMEIDTRVVESQIPSNKGDSGGPLVNDRGELVAVTQGNKPQEQLISFGIELTEVQKVLETVGSDAARPAQRDEPIVKETSSDPDDLPVDDAPPAPPASPAKKRTPAVKPTTKTVVVYQKPTYQQRSACHQKSSSCGRR
jgi:S1-C subfamily serine protease